jgi:predicted NBD/HSP70 family sugar kinase
MPRSPMITVSRGRFSPTAGQALEQVRAGGRVSRDTIAARSGLSRSTVGRAVGQLLRAGILRERPDLATSRVTGRPGVPVEIDTDGHVTVGIHLGRRIATVALGDLTGRVVTQQAVPREPEVPDLERLSRVATGLLASVPGRLPIAASLVAPWHDLALSPTDLGAELHELTGLEVRTADHVSAVAATEFLHRRHGTPGMTLYVYARDTLGFAVAVDKEGQTEVSRPVSLMHFPSGSTVTCECGRSGCLAATASDEAVVRAAGHPVGTPISTVYAAAEEPSVRAILTERARRLGEVAGTVRDMVAPDRVVLVGQAFTGCPPLLEVVTGAYDATSVTGPVPVSFTRFGAGIQAISACTVALGPVLDDPLAVAPGPVHRARRA